MDVCPFTRKAIHFMHMAVHRRHLFIIHKEIKREVLDRKIDNHSSMPCHRGCAVAARAAAVVAATAVVVAVAFCGKCKTMCRVFSLHSFVRFSLFLSPFLTFLPLAPSRALPARLSRLLATLFDGLAPSVGVCRCRHGPTKHLSTTSCVCSTHHALLALSSFPSCLQRILLAL